MIVLETERLRLREWTREDLDFVASMLGDEEVMRFYPRVFSREQSTRWLEHGLERYAAEGHGLWLVERRDTDEPVGQIGVVTQDVNGSHEPEVGYLVHRPFWRNGYASEAACACRDWAFANLDAPRVVSLIRAENVPSQGVARAMGMRVSGTCPHAGSTHDVWSVGRPG